MRDYVVCSIFYVPQPVLWQLVCRQVLNRFLISYCAFYNFILRFVCFIRCLFKWLVVFEIHTFSVICGNVLRSPIPDYYMLTMNKYKDRTTVVRDIVCNSTLKNCPPRFSDGQVYRFRTYNTQCPKTVSSHSTHLLGRPSCF